MQRCIIDFLSFIVCDCWHLNMKVSTQISLLEGVLFDINSCKTQNSRRDLVSLIILVFNVWTCEQIWIWKYFNELSLWNIYADNSFISKTQYFVWNIFNVQCIFLGKQCLFVEGLLDALNFCNISLSTSKEC